MRAGDDIYVERGRYPHHGIYVDDRQVIHSNNVAMIWCTTLEQFAEGAEVQVKQYGEERCFDHPEVVERAKSQIGRSDHKFEQFATWCITGDADGEGPTQALHCRRLEEHLAPNEAELVLSSMVGLAVAHADYPGGEGADIAGSFLDLLKRDGLPMTGLEAFVGDLQRSDSGSAWRARLLDQFGQVTPSRMRVWLADQCVRGTVVSAENLVGPYLRRLDAVLDLAAMPFSVFDVQDEYLGLAADTAAAKVSGLQRGGLFAGRLVGDYAAGYTMNLGAIGLVNKGADYVLGKLGKVDDDACVLSGLLVGASAASLGSDGLGDLLAMRTQLAADIRVGCIALAAARRKDPRVAPKDLDKRINMMQAVAGSIEVLLEGMIERDGEEAFLSAAGHGFQLPHGAHDVVGMSALAAKWLLEYQKHRVLFEDAQGNHKVLFAKSNWHVVSQSVSAGSRASTVVVRVRAFP